MENDDDLAAAPCGYFDGQTARELVSLLPSGEYLLDLWGRPPHVSPRMAQEASFGDLLAHGWRRSNDVLYNAVCPHCRKCQAIRIRAEDFAFSKGQRRLLRRNADVRLELCSTRAAMITEEKAALLRRYDRRHNPGRQLTMDEARDMLLALNGFGDGENNAPVYAGTRNLDYYLDGTLAGVSVLDFASGGVSSNYFFYDTSPSVMKRGLGTFSILREIALCQMSGIEFYYLGYYIAGCPAMSYKGRFRPHQLLVGGEWAEVPRER